MIHEKEIATDFTAVMLHISEWNNLKWDLILSVVDWIVKSEEQVKFWLKIAKSKTNIKMHRWSIHNKISDMH